MEDALIQSSEALALILFYGVSCIAIMISMRLSMKMITELDILKDRTSKLFKLARVIFVIEVIYSLIITFTAVFTGMIGVPIIFANNYTLLTSQSPFASLFVLGGSLAISLLLNIEFMGFTKNKLLRSDSI